MKISLEERPADVTTYDLEGRDLVVGPLRGRHLITASKLYPKATDIEKAYILVAMLSKESQKDGSWTVEELQDLPLSVIKPVLDEMV